MRAPLAWVETLSKDSVSDAPNWCRLVVTWPQPSMTPCLRSCSSLCTDCISSRMAASISSRKSNWANCAHGTPRSAVALGGLATRGKGAAGRRAVRRTEGEGIGVEDTSGFSSEPPTSDRVPCFFCDLSSCASSSSVPRLPSRSVTLTSAPLEGRLVRRPLACVSVGVRSTSAWRHKKEASRPARAQAVACAGSGARRQWRAQAVAQAVAQAQGGGRFSLAGPPCPCRPPRRPPCRPPSTAASARRPSAAARRRPGARSICTARHRKRPARNSVLVPQTSRTS